jgi:DNA polymerase-4
METKVLRKIIHVDMDAFYASIEQRDFPEYRGKPLAVGGSPEGRGGVVATASYEARKFGVRSAMPSKKALQLCPDIIFVRPRFEVYKEVSGRIREIFFRYTDLVEPLSLDEAFMDVTTDKLHIGSAIEIARQIKYAIQNELHLTASAGVSISKFMAKIASEMQKPDGLTFIGPSRVEKFMEQLPVSKFFGVGKVTAEKMNKMGLFAGADLKKMERRDLIHHFGKTGNFFYEIVRGIDNREVEPHRETKSISGEDTFPYDLTTIAEMNNELDKISVYVYERIQEHALFGRTITLKVKFSDFKQITRNFSFPHPVTDRDTIASTAKKLLQNINPVNKRIRLLGIGVSNFGHAPAQNIKHDETGQLLLFDTDEF